MSGDFLAEKEGFEPSNRFWRLHDFQSCALDQLRDFSITGLQEFILAHFSPFVNSFPEKIRTDGSFLFAGGVQA